ncbi:hypothetical protein RUM43_012242 [Polyplax serrata]|uniref:Uncharacterized protein n=1 Tax=Polyplax serrata TaxID=468196 RepID=A0AAN8NWX0_POLSC
MLVFLRRQSHLINRIALGGHTSKRKFLSEAYKCSEAWQNRLSNPAFKKIDFNNVYYQLDLNFQGNKRVSILDVDLFISSQTNYELNNEIEDILTRLRDCPEAVLMPERTSHAVVRLYLEQAPKKDIFNILSNRLTFGIFPDNYTTNRLMNRFLMENDSISAVKIAVLHMLQEEFDHPITRVMALYSCYSYLNSSDVWSLQKEEQDDDDDEVVKVRLEYLKNPYYDDHFDIKIPNHLVGKTLYMLGASVGDTIGASSQLLGLIMYEKYEKAVSFLEEVIKNNTKLYGEAVTMAQDFLVNPPKQELQEEVKEGEGSADKKPTENNASPQDDGMKNQVKSLLEKINKNNLVKGAILPEVEKMVKDAVAANEEKDISNQCKLYKQWEEDRQNHIQEEIDRNNLEELKMKIAKTKEELKVEEQKLFYFDNEELLELEIAAQEKKMESVVYYKEKGKAKALSVDDTYNPPDVNQRKN